VTLIALVTGASSGFGRMIARDLAGAGHTTYASMRSLMSNGGENVRENAAYALERGVDLRSIALDVQDDASVAAAIDEIIGTHGRIDVIVHNAGHMMYGPLEAFIPAQLAEQYDVNVLGTQRLNRAALPHMRAAKSGLIV